MRKIFEFKVFDILQDKENAKFLDNVKKENSDLYTKFLNLIGNKGLDVAKEKYQDYDPENRKRLEEKEKELKRHIKKIGREKFKKEENIRILKKFESEISEIEKILYFSKLYDINSHINKDENISKYFNDIVVKMKYNNDFDKLLKNPGNLYYELDRNFHIDTIVYNFNKFNINNDKLAWILKIHQYYNLKTKKLTYSIHFDTDIFDAYYTPNIDKDKNLDFLYDRNSTINNLGESSQIDIDGIYEILDKYSNVLSDDYYNNWKIINDTNKFNL